MKHKKVHSIYSFVDVGNNSAMATAFQKQLDDLMECPVCTDVYKDPRTLPCQHSYRLICCEGFCRDKHGDDRVECPLCRERFTLPPNGVSGLRKNFVLKKLTQINQPPTGPQTDIDLTAIMITAVPSFCDKHSTKTLDWYCFACKKAICSTCLTQNHKSHDYCILEEVTNELKVALDAGVTDLQKLYEKCKVSLAEVESEEGKFMRHMEMIEAQIIEDAKRLQKMIELSKLALLAEVSAKKRCRQKEMDHAKQEVRQQMTFVSSLMNYTTELLKNGSSGDIAREANSLEKRTSKLLQSIERETTVNDLGTFTLAYTSHEAEIAELGNNLVIGSISPLKMKFIRSLPESNTVNGITVLNKELYVQYNCRDIAVYDTDSYLELRRLDVPGLGGVTDMTSSQRYQCVYISDWKKNVIHKVQVQTARDLFSQWPVGDEPLGLSVNFDHNLVVTCREASKIKVFTTDGKLVQVIQLQKAETFLPYHTLQLTADEYVVCHGGDCDDACYPLHRVCTIDGSGEVKQSFGGSEGSGDKLLNMPQRLAVVNGLIFLVDVGNNRVVVLSPSLRFVRTVVSFTKDGPTRIWFDEQTSRLYVDESKYIYENDEWTTAHVNVYSVCS